MSDSVCCLCQEKCASTEHLENHINLHHFDIFDEGDLVEEPNYFPRLIHSGNEPSQDNLPVEKPIDVPLENSEPQVDPPTPEPGGSGVGKAPDSPKEHDHTASMKVS